MIFSYLLNMQSHPSWVCGLKLLLLYRNIRRYRVTPFVGVWIETALPIGILPSIKCHTLRGCVDWNSWDFWRETEASSHTLRGCVDWNFGLRKGSTKSLTSHPSWVCGLKLHTDKFYNWFDMSHPSWVCGLKQPFCGCWACEFLSHPSWVCGLKQVLSGVESNAR